MLKKKVIKLEWETLWSVFVFYILISREKNRISSYVCMCTYEDEYDKSVNEMEWIYNFFIYDYLEKWSRSDITLKRFYIFFCIERGKKK